MKKSLILKALKILGQSVAIERDLIISGGAAGILCHNFSRATIDIDLIYSNPPMDRDLIKHVQNVAHKLRLPSAWLNDGAKGWADLLPDDFHQRLVQIGRFGPLNISALGRKDLILLKFAALREQDREDLAVMKPTSEEITFVQEQLERISRMRPDIALLMDLYVRQGTGHGY